MDQHDPEVRERIRVTRRVGRTRAALVGGAVATSLAATGAMVATGNGVTPASSASATGRAAPARLEVDESAGPAPATPRWPPQAVGQEQPRDLERFVMSTPPATDAAPGLGAVEHSCRLVVTDPVAAQGRCRAGRCPPRPRRAGLLAVPSWQ